MNFQLSVSPERKRKTTPGREKSFDSKGIDPKTSGLDQPLHCRLSYEARREQVD